MNDSQELYHPLSSVTLFLQQSFMAYILLRDTYTKDITILLILGKN